MMPLLAQGSAMAIEDACMMARCDSVEAGLRVYEKLRAKCTSYTIMRSRAATGLYQSIKSNKIVQSESHFESVYGYNVMGVEL